MVPVLLPAQCTSQERSWRLVADCQQPSVFGLEKKSLIFNEVRSLLSPTFSAQSLIGLCADLGLSSDCPRTLLGLFLSEITAKQV